MKSRIIRLVLGVFCAIAFSQFALAEEKDYSNEPRERAAVYLGAFFIDANSDLSLGFKASGLPKVTVDAEELLGLD